MISNENCCAVKVRPRLRECSLDAGLLIECRNDERESWSRHEFQNRLPDEIVSNFRSDHGVSRSAQHHMCGARGATECSLDEAARVAIAP